MSTATRDNVNGARKGNVLDFFSGKTHQQKRQEHIVRLSPEYDGLSMLYTNSHTRKTDTYYSMRILCWGLRANGDVVALVPWLNKIVSCTALEDPANGSWEGYYDHLTGEITYKAPPYKVAELKSAANYFGTDDEFNANDGDAVIQEIPDTIGTHAMLACTDEKTLVLTEVLSWRLYNNGFIEAMLIDDDKITQTPVLPGDPCLYRASQNKNFRYFFQHHIANQIKAENPDAMEAISLLLDD